jgi:surface protein
MFGNNLAFNQHIGGWNVSNVTNMGNMFHNAREFNQPINNWDTIRVTDMIGMFGRATNFNQWIGQWNTSNVVCMIGMFSGATRFNNGFSCGESNQSNRLWWNVLRVNGFMFSFMFNDAVCFNANISHWVHGDVNSHNPASGFRRNSALRWDFTPRAILNAPDRGQ